MIYKKIRKYISFPLIVSAILFATLIPAAVSSAQEPETISRQRITDITIEGNNTVSKSTILSRIKTRIGTEFIQRTVNEDIKNLYATGFFTDVSAKAEDYKDGIRIIFSVVEKSVVGDIVFQGNKIYRDELLKKQIDTKQSDVLNMRILAEDAKKIEAFYKQKGFALVDVSYSIETDESTNASTITITIDEKKQYRIKNQG